MKIKSQVEINKIETRKRGLYFIVLTVLLSLFYTTLLFGATIYIDPTNTASGQNGTITNPYSSWNQVTFVNGNEYLQKRGTVFTTTGGISITNRSNITIGAYGSGSRPVIRSSSSTARIVRIVNSTNCTIRGIEVTSTNNNITGPIAIGIDETSTNALVDSCLLHSCHYGVSMFPTVGTTGIRILNTTIHNVGDDGIYARDMKNIEIGYCNIYDVNKKYLINPDQNYAAGDCIQLVGNLNPVNSLVVNIHNNILDHSTMGNKFCLIIVGDHYSGTIANNEMVGSSSTSCMYLWHSTGTVTVKNNYIRNGSYGIYSYVNNLQVHYNKFVNNALGVTVLASSQNSTNLTALNNVFYGNTSCAISITNPGSSLTSRNNIFYLTSASQKAYSTGSAPVTSNYNTFNTQHVGFINSYSTLAAWRSATGDDLNSFVANPNFVSPSTGNFMLQENSPCINTGMNVQLQHDFYGTPVPQAGACDIGHHEYVANQGSNLPPVINNQSFSVIFGATNGTVVGTVVASDPNAGQTLTFSITGGNTNNVFYISPSTGVITVANSSGMTSGNYSLTVRATDNGSPVMFSQATVNIAVTTANQPPVINNQSFSVLQGSSNGTVVGTVIATDPNAGQTLTFSITGGNTNNVFYISPSTGIITVANSSSMTLGNYSLTVRATDNGSPVMFSQATVSISVISNTNQPPVINNQAFSVVANPSNGTTVGIVIASDPNAGQIITFSITGGNTNNAFYIVPSTGRITVGNSWAVNPGVFYLTVRVTDNGSPVMWSEANITITVNGSGNQAPVINNQSFSVLPNPGNGSIVGTVAATDPDAGQTLTFSITGGNTNNAFYIVPATGRITVGNSWAVTAGVFSLTVRATDNGSPVMWSEATVTINVTGSSNQPPVIQAQSFNINENSANGTLVGTVIASDPNAGQTLNYSITSGNTNNAFAINQANGNLTVSNFAMLNYEATSAFYLTVRVTDNGTGNLWSAATITVSLNDINEAPVLNPVNLTVAEFAPNGTFVGIVTATDPDQGQSFTFQIISGNTLNAFHVNMNNGAINVINSSALNASVNPVFYLQVRVQDNGQPSLSSTGIVRIDVLQLKQDEISEDLLSEEKAAPVFKIYPNPSSDGYFMLSAENQSSVAEVAIMDISGKLIENITVMPESVTTLNLAGRQKGVYFIKILCENQIQNLKAIVN